MRSAAINCRSASAPCHQPNFAPVTTQVCWYRKWRTWTGVGCGWAAIQVESRCARWAREISFNGSFGAFATAKAGGRLVGAGFVGAAAAGCAAFGLVVAALCFAAFGEAGTGAA